MKNEKNNSIKNTIFTVKSFNHSNIEKLRYSIRKIKNKNSRKIKIPSVLENPNLSEVLEIKKSEDSKDKSRNSFEFRNTNTNYCIHNYIPIINTTKLKVN